MKPTSRVYVLITVGCLCLVWTLSCGKNETIVGGFTHVLSGTVYDSNTSQAIDSALVTWGDTVDSPRVQTDSNGIYQIVVPVASTTIFIRNQGYKTGTLRFDDIRSDISGIYFYLVPQ